MRLKIAQVKWITEHLKKTNMSDREIMDAKQGVTRKSIAFRDPVVERVVDKFIHRSDVGYKKYMMGLSSLPVLKNICISLSNKLKYTLYMRVQHL